MPGLYAGHDFEWGRKMRQYITRRILQMIPILIGVSIILYLVFSMAPGNIVEQVAGNRPNISQKKIDDLNKAYGLNENIVVRYGKWAAKAARFDFGQSWKYKQPVSHVINTYMWNSFYLAISSFILSFVIAIPIGVVSATKQYSIFDQVFTIFALIGISIPTFFFGLLLIKWLAVDLKIFPVSGMEAIGSAKHGIARTLDVLHHMFLPLLVLTLGGVAGYMRFSRTSMLEVIRQDYVRTARAKGLSEKVVIYKHALRNGLIPIITIIGLGLSGLFGGAIMTESIFKWPGIGTVALNALNSRDYPFLMGFNMFIAVLTLLGNLIADITYALVDPRVRLK